MRYQDTGLVLKACQMAFNGTKNGDIAKKLDVDPSVISRWRKLPVWKEFHAELLEVQKKALLDVQLQDSARDPRMRLGSKRMDTQYNP